MTSLRETALAWLSFPRVLWVTLGLTVLLWLPTLGHSFWRGDEWAFFAANEQGRAYWSNTRFDAWRFQSGEPEEMKALIHRGALPWFTLPEVKFAVWRPLASAIVALVHAAFGGHDALGWHVVQLCLYLLLIATVARFYCRFVPGLLGALALLVFAVDDAHWDLSWPTCLYQPVALIPALLGLMAHLRWREEGWGPGRVLSLVGFGVGLLGGENALQMMAYVLAYELVAVRAWRRIVSGLLPLALVAGVYLIIYKLLGHGVFGRVGYVDPFAEPLAFLPHAAFNFAAHAANMFTAAPRYIFERLRLFPELGPVPISAIVVLLLAFLLLLRPALRSLPEAERRPLPWLLLGALLAVIPGLGGPITDRLILPSSIGASVLIVAVARYGWRVLRGQVPAPPLKRWVVPVACALTTLPHLVLAPIATPLIFREFRRQGEASLQVLRTADIPPAAQDVAMLVASSTNLMLNQWAGFIREYETGRASRHWWVLTFRERDDQLLTRTRADGFELALADNVLPELGQEAGFRDFRRFPLKAGDEVSMDRMRVRVLEASHGIPTRFEVTFDRSLEDPTLAFVAVDGKGGLRRVELPPVGQTLLLPAVLPRTRTSSPARAPAQSPVPPIVRPR
jgi:hypothetical protein